MKYTNDVIRTEDKYVCVSRPRRFGKSMAADMLVAYYSRGCNSKEMFSGYKIADDLSFKKHLNKYNVIHINMVNFLGEAKNIEEMIKFIEEDIIDEITEEFPDLKMPRRIRLLNVLNKVFSQYKIPFIFIIDEWDCVFRIFKGNKEDHTEYLNFLRNLLKDQSYIALAYMTGILPIKKYGEHSALNMFTEVSMTDSREYAEFTGFAELEVAELCQKYNMPYDETKKWYDGYDLMGVSIYNPRSVVMSMTGGYFNNYWTSTETYEALEEFICRNDDGLRDTIVRLLSGEKKVIDPSTFTNDMVTFNSQDDVLTLLVHLGYLTFDFNTKEVSIPNYEVSEQFAKYDKNSLACVLSIAYYSARKDYIIHREFATGNGFADLVFIPRNGRNLPAMIVELKKDLLQVKQFSKSKIMIIFIRFRNIPVKYFLLESIMTSKRGFLKNS